jgi:hypothetical protein
MQRESIIDWTCYATSRRSLEGSCLSSSTSRNDTFTDVKPPERLQTDKVQMSDSPMHDSLPSEHIDLPLCIVISNMQENQPGNGLT